MYRSPLSVPKVAGAYLALHGAVFALHGSYRLPRLAELVPSADVIGFVNPLLFLATALCFWAAAASQPHRLRDSLARACAWLLVVTPAVYLLDELAGGVLGMEDALRSVPTSHESLGRLSPNSSLAFFLTGAAFLTLVRPLQGRRKAIFVGVAVVVGLIGLAGILGHLLGLETLYKLPNFNRLLPPTGVAFAIVGAGLWCLQEQTQDVPLQAIEGRIARRTLAVLTLVALGAGVAGYSVMRTSYEESVAKNLALAANTTASSLAHTVKLALAFPRTVSTLSGVAQALSSLAQDPAEPKARELLSRVSRNILGTELTRSEFYTAAGDLVAESGRAATKSKVSHVLKGTHEGATLGWNAGYFLVSEYEVRHEGALVGRIVTEQRLALFDRLLSDVASANDSADAALCSIIEDNKAVCAPTRIRTEAFTIPLRDAAGQPAFPIVRALLGQTGVVHGKDPRGIDVVSAHVPIDDFGLGLAVKSDVSTLYAPLRARLALLVVSVGAIIGLAIYALRSQVRPVVGRLAQSERSLKAILEEQSELVSLAKPDGELTYVNAAYARHFGLRPEQMIGQNLYTHVEPRDVDAVRALVSRVMETGRPVNGENRMVQADGGSRWVAWTNSCQRDPQGKPMLHSVGRDITERKSAELALQESQAILRSVTELMPAIVAVVGTDERYKFVNSAFEGWLGRKREEVVGRTIAEVLPEGDYRRSEPYIKQALRGERVHFERGYEGRASSSHLSVTYIPLARSDGGYDGFVAVARDITEQKNEEFRLLHLSRVDALTGLLNRGGFEEALADSLGKARAQDRPALFCIDLDRFKQVNDSHGHPVGDQLLKQFAMRLRGAVRPTDAVGRIGGDEFAVIAFGVRGRESADVVAKNILSAAIAPFDLDGITAAVGASVGVGFATDADRDPLQFLSRVDALLYRAKHLGRGQVVFDAGDADERLRGD